AYLQSQPNDPAALIRLAALQQREGAVDEAVKIYERVVAEYPSYSPAIRQLALLYGQRDNAKAFDLATRARQAYPGDPEINKLLGTLSYRLDLLPQSVDLLKQAAAKRAGDPEILYYLGEAYHKLKQLNECKVMLQQALKLNLSAALADGARKSLDDCS